MKRAMPSRLGKAGMSISLATGSLDEPIEATFKRRVTGSFIVALLLTIFMGFFSLRSTRLAADDADWVVHTYAVIATLEVTHQHVIDLETSARTFALAGQAPLLAHYVAARDTVAQDLDGLRHLTADNPNQQGRLDVLEPQVRAALEFAARIVGQRQRTDTAPSATEILETESLMGAVRATTQEMQDEETQLLSRRIQRTKMERRLTSFILVVGVLVGAGLLAVAKFAINSEIEESARARAQLKALNAGLEQRVEERTAALQSEVAERTQTEEQLAGQAEELSRQTEELLRSQQALETQTLMLQSVLDSMAEGLVAADERGKFIIWNPAAAKILGLGAANLPSQEWTAHYGLYLEDMVTPFPADQLPLVRAIRGEASISEMFVRNSELDHGTWIEASGGPLKDKNGAARGGVVAFRDISQRRADEREIHQLNEELEERVVKRTAQLEVANRELEAFTYSVSHDLRAPLRHIGGFSKILTEDFGPAMDPEARRHLQRIEDGVHRMGLLVDELLNLARVGRHALDLRDTRLNSVVEEVVALLRPETDGRAVSWEIANLPSAECDPILIKQVFQNLLSNALKFTRTRKRAVIEINHRQENGQRIILIRDNGVGFSMKYQDKLFGVFQRLHRAEDFEGTGIGLATVQRIIHKHGGRVWAESELEKGATFSFTLAAAKSNPYRIEQVDRDDAVALEVKAIDTGTTAAAAGA